MEQSDTLLFLSVHHLTVYRQEMEQEMEQEM